MSESNQDWRRHQLRSVRINHVSSKIKSINWDQCKILIFCFINWLVLQPPPAHLIVIEKGKRSSQARTSPANLIQNLWRSLQRPMAFLGFLRKLNKKDLTFSSCHLPNNLTNLQCSNTSKPTLAERDVTFTVMSECNTNS